MKLRHIPVHLAVQALRDKQVSSLRTAMNALSDAQSYTFGMEGVLEKIGDMHQTGAEMRLLNDCADVQEVLIITQDTLSRIATKMYPLTDALDQP